MKAFVFLSILAVASAASVSSEREATILRQDADINVDGSFVSSFETSNGIAESEQGVLKNVGTENEAAEVSGSAQWTAPDGTPVQLTWVANENGFQPQGSHLPVAPTPPPIPAAIQRALDWIAAHPPPPERP